MYSQAANPKASSQRGAWGGLAGHFGINKTIDMLKEHFFWPKMGGDVHEVIFKCSIYLKAKS